MSDWDDEDVEFRDEDEEASTAYHEAGHAVIGCSLGATIERVRLFVGSSYDDDDDGLPARFGDCLVNWGRVAPEALGQPHKELLTILAGPIAQSVYENAGSPQAGQSVSDAAFFAGRAASYQHDWQQALRCADRITRDPARQASLLRQAISELREVIHDDACWSAIAAVADELLTGEELDGEQVADLVRFWWR